MKNNDKCRSTHDVKDRIGMSCIPRKRENGDKKFGIFFCYYKIRFNSNLCLLFFIVSLIKNIIFKIIITFSSSLLNYNSLCFLLSKKFYNSLFFFFC